MRDSRPNGLSTAARVTSLYLIVGLFWIVVSDWLIFTLSTSDELRLGGEIAKGILFVLLSSGMIYLLIRRSTREQRRARREVDAYAARLQLFFDRIPLLLAFLDDAGELQMVNQRWEKSLGWNASEADAHRELLARICDHASEPDGDLVIRNASGDRVLTNWRGVRLADGTQLCIGEDLTPRHEARMALEESEQRLRTVVDNMPVIFFALSPDGTFEISEGRGLQQVGLSPGEVVGENALEIYGGHDKIQGYVERALQGEGFQGTAELEGRIFEFSYWPLESDDGTFEGTTCIAIDITEREKAERALRRSEARQQAIVRGIPDLVFRIDREGTYLDVHVPRPQDLLVPEEEIVGSSIRNVAPPHLAEQWLAGIRRALETGEIQQLEYGLETITGQEQFFEARIAPLDARSVLFIARNMTEHRAAQRALQESEERLRLALEAAGMGIWDYHLRSGNVTWSGYSERLFGLEEGEFGGTIEDVRALIHPADREQVRARLEEAIAERGQIQVEHRILHTDGSVRWVRGHGHTIVDEEGQPLRLIGTMMDITSTKRREQRLHESEERWRKLVEHSPVTLLIHRRGRVVYANEAAARLIGSGEPSKLVGQQMDTLVAPEDHFLYEESDDPSDAVPLTYRLVGAEERYLETTSVPIRYEGERAVLTVVHDITTRRQYEEGLVEAKNHAEEMSRLKSAFLANMSHEIRTPLTSIIGFSDLLAEDVEEANREPVSMIRKGAHRLMETLTSVLDLAQLEAGTLKLSKVKVDVEAEVRETIELVSQRAREKDLQLSIVNEQDAPVRAELDPGAFRRILTNLLSNAVKFTEAGQITARIDATPDEVILHITDTGVGIDPKYLPHLFDEFSQESRGLARTHEGSGLGLAITTKLVRLMDGEIEVESEKGEGSTFTVRLPRARVLSEQTADSA